MKAQKIARDVAFVAGAAMLFVGLAMLHSVGLALSVEGAGLIGLAIKGVQ